VNGVPGPAQLTAPPSPISHVTFSGVAVADTWRPGTLAVADSGCQASTSVHRNMGKFTHCGPPTRGLMFTAGDAKRIWFAAFCARSVGLD